MTPAFWHPVTYLPMRLNFSQSVSAGFAADLEHVLTACCKSYLSVAQLFSLTTVLLCTHVSFLAHFFTTWLLFRAVHLYRLP